MNTLLDALRDPARYPHPVKEVEVIETHISWVLLAGGYAYKVKKPVRLPFLDYSSLESRHRFCDEELRLNRRTAPELYLDVVQIAHTGAGPMIGAAGTPLEYAVRMRRFAAGALADRMARSGALGQREVDAIAAALVGFHADLPRARGAEGFGTQERIAAAALGNLEQILALGADPGSADRLALLRAWTAGECERLGAAFASRVAGGWVRECHGDLHLGNIAIIEGRAVPFDCIEFDSALRWIDVMSEAAFLVMDLMAHGFAGAAWRLLNAWLEASGDYEGIAVLRFYLVYRAMVRAKIASLRAEAGEYRSYLALAESLVRIKRPALILMHGVSGSGKTTVAQAALERYGAVRARSDLERKRLHGIDPGARVPAALEAGIYAAAASARTYGRLAAIAGGILDAGYIAIVDAAFLRRAEREIFFRLARSRDIRLLIAACSAPEATLRRRVAERQNRTDDASDAGVDVLQHQFDTRQPLLPEEEEVAMTIDTASDAGARLGLEAIAARLVLSERAVAPLGLGAVNG